MNKNFNQLLAKALANQEPSEHDAEIEKAVLSIVRSLAENNIRLSELDTVWGMCKDRICFRDEEPLPDEWDQFISGGGSATTQH